jgi:hypothetical protein
MRAGGNYRGARTIGLALGAGLIAFEFILALSTGWLGIPGLFVVALGSGDVVVEQTPETLEGGESDFAKLSAVPASPSKAPVAEAAKPLSPAPPAGGPPRLNGLADVPLTLNDDAESNAEKPDHLQHFAANSAGWEVLPWDEVEPVPFPSEDSASPAQAHSTAALPRPGEAAPTTQAALAQLPASSDVESWVKAKATEIKGVERARPLYHFEFWLEPPDEVKQRLAAVIYEFNTPAVMPQSQASSERNRGFRISAGGLTCADQVTITLKFRDGRTEQVTVDGCRLVS